jgi:hypothetical protein
MWTEMTDKNDGEYILQSSVPPPVTSPGGYEAFSEEHGGWYGAHGHVCAVLDGGRYTMVCVSHLFLILFYQAGELCCFVTM